MWEEEATCEMCYILMWDPVTYIPFSLRHSPASNLPLTELNVDIHSVRVAFKSGLVDKSQSTLQKTQHLRQDSSLIQSSMRFLAVSSV